MQHYTVYLSHIGIRVKYCHTKYCFLSLFNAHAFLCFIHQPLLSLFDALCTETLISCFIPPHIGVPTCFAYLMFDPTRLSRLSYTNTHMNVRKTMRTFRESIHCCHILDRYMYRQDESVALHELFGWIGSLHLRLNFRRHFSIWEWLASTILAMRRYNAI